MNKLTCAAAALAFTVAATGTAHSQNQRAEYLEPQKITPVAIDTAALLRNNSTEVIPVADLRSCFMLAYTAASFSNTASAVNCMQDGTLIQSFRCFNNNRAYADDIMTGRVLAANCYSLHPVNTGNAQIR